MYDPNLPRSRVFLPAILSGLLLYAAFFPLNLGFLAWVSLVPFLSLVRANARSRRIYFAAFVGGLFCYVPAIQWIRVAHPAMYGAWIFLAICCSIFLVMTLAIIRKLDRTGLPLWLSAPFGFIAMEYFRSHFPTGYTWMEMFNARHPIGFGWYMIGHTQHDFSSLSQIADLTGVYGVSFIVVVVNAALWLAFEKNALLRVWLRHIREPQPTGLRPAIVAATLLAVSVVYGVFRTNHEQFADGPRVALIQGNLEQDIKNQNGKAMWEHFDRLANQAVDVKPDQKPDLVIWPETSVAYGWFDVQPGINVQSLEYEFQRGFNGSRLVMSEDAFRWRIPMLYGLGTRQWETDNREWRYNSALLVDAKGNAVARYDKIHLVPLGEYVPYPNTFPFLKHFQPYEGDYSCRPGESYTRFPLPVGEKTYHFACLICYEDTDASLARQYVRPGAEGVDFFVNISNDGWFQGTAEHEQHLAICRFRAIETRRSVVRAVNMGISAIIDPDGRVVALPGETWAKSKKVEGIVRGPVPLDTRTSLYARLGDWLPLCAWGVFASSIVLGFVRRRPTNTPATAAS
jgi:apolipoprotein N-acyltransferase